MNFFSKKEEKKQTLKKKNIHYNNSFVRDQHFQKEKERSKHYEDINFTQNDSYFSRSDKKKQFIREELKKEGPFRRDSSTSNSKGKFKR